MPNNWAGGSHPMTFAFHASRPGPFPFGLPFWFVLSWRAPCGCLLLPLFFCFPLLASLCVSLMHASCPAGCACVNFVALAGVVSIFLLCVLLLCVSKSFVCFRHSASFFGFAWGCPTPSPRCYHGFSSKPAGVSLVLCFLLPSSLFSRILSFVSLFRWEYVFRAWCF